MTTTSQSIPSLLLLTSLRYDPLLLTSSWNTWPGNPPSPFFLLPYHLERLIDGARDFEWPMALKALGVATKREEKSGIGSENCEYKYVVPLKRFRSICQDCVDRYFAKHPGSDVDYPLKIRMTLSPVGTLHAEASSTPRRPYDLFAASTLDPSSLNAATVNTSLDLSTLTLPLFASPPLRVLLDTQPTSPSILTTHKTTARSQYDAARARASIPPLSSSAPFSSPPTEILLHIPGSSASISEGSLRNVAFYRGSRWTTPPLSTGCLPGTARRWLIESGRIVEDEIPRSEVRVGEWVMLCNGVEGCVLGVVVGTADGAREVT